MVIDCGNGNIKAMVGGKHLVMPSVISFNYEPVLRGAYSLNGQDVIVGRDNLKRPDRIEVVNVDNGKLEYLHYLIGGAISAMEQFIPRSCNLSLRLLTLNPKARPIIEEKLSLIKGFSIDGEKYNLNVKLASLYPEGYGASLYAAKQFPNAESVAVLDIGNGTINLSHYYMGGKYPRRESMEFYGDGFKTIIKAACDLYRNDTSNGDIRPDLMRDAFETNSFRYYYNLEKPTDVSKVADKAISAWLTNPNVKDMMRAVCKDLDFGIPVICCGGGFQVGKVYQGIHKALRQNENFHCPEFPLMLGVKGIYDHIVTPMELNNEQQAA